MRRLLVIAAVVVVAAGALVGTWVWRDRKTNAEPTIARRVAGRLSCGGADGSPTFTTAMLNGPALPDSVVFGDGPGRALRAFLAGRYGTAYPITREGEWIMILREPAQVTYVHRQANGLVALGPRKERGKWKVTGWGGCEPRYQGSIRWEVGALPGPGTVTFPIGYITGGKCNGPTHELLGLDHVDVVETIEAVTITLYRAQDLPPPGWKPPKNAGCSAGGTMARTTVALKSPMGTRQLLDGGPVPPTPVTPTPFAP